jgi:MFS family permease
VSSDESGAGTGSKGALRAPFHHRDFRFLIAGNAVSGTGDWLYNVALIVFVLERTGSGAWVAAASVIRFLPYILFGTFGGVIADRYDRKKVMIAADLGRGTVMVLLTLVAAAQGEPLMAIFCAALSTTMSAVYLPCVNASTPAIVGEEDLTAANAVISTVENVTLALGPAVGGILLILGSPAIAFGVNAATFFLSALLTVPIRTKLSTAAQEGEEESPSFRARVIEGFKAITSSAEVSLLVLLSVAICVAYGQEIVLYSLAAEGPLGMGADGVGFLFAAIGVGGILAAGVLGRISGAARQGTIVVVATLVSAVPMILLAWVHHAAAAVVLLTVEGAAVIIADVVYMTMLQRILPRSVLGRVMGIMDSLMVTGILIGSLIAPAIVSAAGLSTALVVGGLLLIVPVLLVLPKARDIDRKTARRAAELEPRVAVLERLGIFEGASRQMLEALAGALTVEDVPDGTTVIHEGEEPDDLFVVVAGRLGVSSRGEGVVERALPELGSDDYFGEIGLLERIPRTATVRTLTDCHLYRIPGEDFLRIVTEGPRAMGNLRTGVAVRLARTHPSEELGHA